MVERFRFFKIQAFFVMLFLCFLLGFSTLVLGEEVSRIHFLYSPLKVQVDNKIYQLGYVLEGTEKYLVVLDLKGKVVEDSKVLEKVFFVEYVYRPVFDKPKEFNGPVEIGGYRKLDEYRLMQQLADVTLFLREAGVMALVQAGKAYITGGSSVGASVGEKIAEKTAEHLIESILTNPATYLKGTVSLVFEDAASRWKKAEALYLKTKVNNVLRYEDAKKIHDDLSYGRGYGIESMTFLAKLTLQEGGGSDLLSQLQKIREYAWDEFVSEVKGLYKQKNLVTAAMLGYKLETFLLSKVPIYKEYVENTKGFYKELNEYYGKYYSPERIERNNKLAKLTKEKNEVSNKKVSVVNLQMERLNETTIKRLFQDRLNEDNRSYEIKDIKWQEGAFTKKGSLEAIVYFYDMNQCHASSEAELWLLQYDQKWKISKKVEESDKILFRVIDLEKDGMLEVFIQSSAGNQGYYNYKYELISLRNGSRSTLYLTQGFDNIGAEIEGEASHLHKIEFKDIDNDGTLEIVDTVERAIFAWSGKKGESNYTQTSSSKDQIAYKWINGKFTQIAKEQRLAHKTRGSSSGETIPKSVSERIEKFVWEGGFVFGETQAQITGRLGKPKALRMQSQSVVGLLYDDLYIELLKIPKEKSELILKIVVTSDRYKMKWNANVGLDLYAIERMFGKPPARFDTRDTYSVKEINKDTIKYTYFAGLGEVQFYFKNNILSKIVWEFHPD